ncbi:uncharacterized protein LOC123524526 isoform X2 [Mercenaria mercenaria]|uniref:uncharacterized protein LOC123524526 isoform X2 n=1 Tax=Mercenaria mercenaria TaxID=6596 RepID=UPI001E1D5467|nr:uncharacterized protein LOC123524526 isoform X2 [Mercenaria mercenaria]
MRSLWVITMNLRGGKASTAAMVAGVAAAECVSILYYMFTPWFLGPGERSLYTSIGCNILLFLLIFRLVEKYWYLKTWQDAVKMGVWLTLIYISVNAPYVITWWNPASYLYLLGPAAHTAVQISAMTLSIWYFKNKK